MAQANPTIDVADLIETQKLNWFRISIFIWACLVMGFEGYDMQVLAYAAPSIIKAWHVNKAAFGPAFGLGLFGFMLGALLLSHLGDRYGRKNLIIGGCVMFGIFTLATSYVHTLSALMILRTLAGLGLGVSIPNTIAMSAEYSATRVRATMIGVMFVGYNLGSTVGGVIAAKYVATLGWPILFQIGGIAPILLAGVLIFAMPESIRFLALKQNQPERVAAIVARLAPNQTITPETRFILREEQHGGLPVKNLFTEGRATMTVLLWLAFAMSLVGHYFLTSWMPTVLEGSGVSMSHAVLAGSMFQFGGGIGNLVVAWFLDKRGIIAIAGAFALAAPLTILIGFTDTSTALLMTVVFFAGLCMLGGQAGLNALSGTLYPTYIRSTGSGWAFGVGRVGSILGPVLGGFLISMMPISSLFILVSVPVFCCAAAIFFLGRTPETVRARQAPVLS